MIFDVKKIQIRIKNEMNNNLTKHEVNHRKQVYYMYMHNSKGNLSIHYVICLHYIPNHDDDAIG